MAAFAVPIVGMTAPTLGMTRAGLHVRGTLHEDAPDLQPGYFVLCGVDGGPCHAQDAIAISVHPDNRIYMDSLREKVGRTVQLSIF